MIRYWVFHQWYCSVVPGKEKVIAEAFPQNEVSEPSDLLNGGFGNLEKSREDNRTDPASISQEDKEKVPLPEGLSETEFVNKITESVNSYDNSADYDMLPDETGEGVNSNSFVGSVLRKSGSNFTPSVNAPGFGKDIFSQPKASTETLTQKIENALKSIIDRIKK
jgi:hypothetical protein